MSEQRKILVVADFESDAHLLVDRAAMLARLLACSLDIVFCDSTTNTMATSIAISSDAQSLRNHIMATQESFVHSLVDRVKDAGVDATGTVLQERPVQDGVLFHALETNPYVVMKGTEFHSSAERGILVDTDWQLMRTCPYPLWFVKRESFDSQPTIIAAVDPMHQHDKSAALDQIIVDAANTIAKASDGDVHLIHTYERLFGIGSAASKAIKATKLPIDEIDERNKKLHKDALDALAENNHIDAKHTHQLPGRTRDIIPTFVRSRDADLVVMGALARWGIKRMLIGSTAERVLDHLPCDVLIVRDGQYQLNDATTDHSTAIAI